ncbi:putative phosphoric diester hydrolase-like protein [Phaeomoniella chlamydospora]|uniref:Putative phosphoric diester hydrolase-like protein n=1 Tax=Phaeomoniella chlamydospora TaxID=158046 RepID=A0A0G2EBG4_PHACM|nr:putative phosphoric diester hydrolase-like protein [Phaeomoniella chlamydospora]
MLKWNLLLSVLLLPFVYANPVQRRNTTTACNNSPDLCDKPYGTITHLGAHDSPFTTTRSENDTSANQYYNSTQQLSAGVRLLTAQVHESDGEYHLCHSSCLLYDAGTLESWLSDIKGWMDDNPNDGMVQRIPFDVNNDADPVSLLVVTILLVNSDDLSADTLGSIFASSGIDSYAYTPSDSTTSSSTSTATTTTTSAGSPSFPFATTTTTSSSSTSSSTSTSTSSPIAPSDWPTLSDLISAGTRLVTFIASLDETSDTYPYLLDEFAYIFENNYDVTSLSNFTCEPQRPTDLAGDTSSALSSGRLPFTNHFLGQDDGLGIQSPNLDEIDTTNSPSTTTTGALGTSAQDCKSEYNGQQPTFLLVDFFDVGPSIDTVDSLNNVSSSVTGRTQLSSSDSSSSSTSDGVRAAKNYGGENAIWGLIGVVAFMVTCL